MEATPFVLNCQRCISVELESHPCRIYTEKGSRSGDCSRILNPIVALRPEDEVGYREATREKSMYFAQPLSSNVDKSWPDHLKATILNQYHILLRRFYNLKFISSRENCKINFTPFHIFPSTKIFMIIPFYKSCTKTIT